MRNILRKFWSKFDGLNEFYKFFAIMALLMPWIISLAFVNYNGWIALGGCAYIIVVILSKDYAYG